MALALGLLTNASANHNYRPDAAPLGEKGYRIDSKTELFMATGSFDHDGESVSFTDSEAFSVIDSDLRVRYGYGENLEFFVGGGFRNVSATYYVDDESITTSKAGLERYFGGVRYAAQSSAQLFYAVEGLFGQTPYTNTDYSSLSDVPNDEVALGDGGSFYQASVLVSYLSTKDHIYNLMGAYRQPGNNLSPEFVYSANSVWTWNTLSASLGVEGVYSTGGDAYSSNPDEKPIQGRAASYLYNSINHFIFSPKVGLYWGMGSWRVGVTGSMVGAGQSTDQGYRMGLELTKVSGGVKVDRRKKETFKEYNIEATVLKVSPRGKFIQIDQGVSQDVEKGMRFDIYDTDFFGGNELIATGIVYEVSLNRAILKLVKKYTKSPVKKGFTARAQ